jgi:hypothetical protein
LQVEQAEGGCGNRVRVTHRLGVVARVADTAGGREAEVRRLVLLARPAVERRPLVIWCGLIFVTP